MISHMELTPANHCGEIIVIFAGNTFSTLDSAAFDWTLISDSESGESNLIDAHDILR